MGSQGVYETLIYPILSSTLYLQCCILSDDCKKDFTKEHFHLPSSLLLGSPIGSNFRNTKPSEIA